MTDSEARSLLGNNPILPNQKQTWADLGCGGGFFTNTLAHLLPSESHIFALDSDETAMGNIPDQKDNVSIEKVNANFIVDDFPFEELDGILMANSLHYVAEKSTFIEKIKRVLKPNSCILIVEYEADKPNPWVPFPESFHSLQTLFEANGFTSITKIHTMPSTFGHTIYSAKIIY